MKFLRFCISQLLLQQTYKIKTNYIVYDDPNTTVCDALKKLLNVSEYDAYYNDTTLTLVKSASYNKVAISETATGASGTGEDDLGTV